MMNYGQEMDAYLVGTDKSVPVHIHKTIIVNEIHPFAIELCPLADNQTNIALNGETRI